MEKGGGEVYLIQHFVVKFVSDEWQIGGFLSSYNKTDRHNITEILVLILS